MLGKYSKKDLQHTSECSEKNRITMKEVFGNTFNSTTMVFLRGLEGTYVVMGVMLKIS